MNVKIFTAGFNMAMSQHLFYLMDGGAGTEQVLSIGMAPMPSSA
jgi:hypothetical protein